METGSGGHAAAGLDGLRWRQGEKYLQDGFVYFQQQDYDKAIESYEKAIGQGVRSPAAYNMLGMAYRFKYQQTQDQVFQGKEIVAFQTAIEIDPKFWGAMVNLGTTYYSRGEKAAAAKLFKQALTLNPNPPEKAQMEKMIAEAASKEPQKAPKPGKSSRKHSESASVEEEL